MVSSKYLSRNTCTVVHLVTRSDAVRCLDVACTRPELTGVAVGWRVGPRVVLGRLGWLGRCG